MIELIVVIGVDDLLPAFVVEEFREDGDVGAELVDGGELNLGAVGAVIGDVFHELLAVVRVGEVGFVGAGVAALDEGGIVEPVDDRDLFDLLFDRFVDVDFDGAVQGHFAALEGDGQINFADDGGVDRGDGDDVGIQNREFGGVAAVFVDELGFG